ncbi:FGGY family carbohydrate kinase, partial [Deinococcus pimensis]|uniref:FGGY family carbohydrate kinase n=1 Tax=Deinococcus pimensis TaxID=309888 RepID=UPI001FE08674
MSDPSMVPVVLGVDLGTTAAKVVAFDDAGREVARASHGYPLETPEPGAAEQDADLVLRAALAGLSEVT